MTFSERIKEVLEQSLVVSKEFAVKAGAKAQDMSERGLLMWDIKQLENQVSKLMAKLGSMAYMAFVERDDAALERDNLEVKTILDEIAIIKNSIEKKENELKYRAK